VDGEPPCEVTGRPWPGGARSAPRAGPEIEPEPRPGLASCGPPPMWPGYRGPRGEESQGPVRSRRDAQAKEPPDPPDGLRALESTSDPRPLPSTPKAGVRQSAPRDARACHVVARLCPETSPEERPARIAFQTKYVFASYRSPRPGLAGPSAPAGTRVGSAHSSPTPPISKAPRGFARGWGFRLMITPSTWLRNASPNT